MVDTRSRTLIFPFATVAFIIAFLLCDVSGIRAVGGQKKLAKDLDTSATGYGGYGGQVHISVHRGPSEKHGYHYFAPFSYYVRQPEDSHHYKGYH